MFIIILITMPIMGHQISLDYIYHYVVPVHLEGLLAVLAVSLWQFYCCLVTLGILIELCLCVTLATGIIKQHQEPHSPEHLQRGEPRGSCLPHRRSSRLSELVGLFTKLQKGSSAGNEDSQKARRRKHLLGPGSTGKVKRLASDVEDREKLLQAKECSRNLERCSTSGKSWVLPKVLATR